MIRRISPLQNSQVWHYIYEKGNRVGKFSLSIEKDGSIGFWNFVIFPEFRKKGYGKKSIKDLISRLKKQNKEKLYLYVAKDNKIAHDLYKSLSFKTYKETDYSFWMELKLSA